MARLHFLGSYRLRLGELPPVKTERIMAEPEARIAWRLFNFVQYLSSYYHVTYKTLLLDEPRIFRLPLLWFTQLEGEIPQKLWDNFMHLDERDVLAHARPGSSTKREKALLHFPQLLWGTLQPPLRKK